MLTGKLMGAGGIGGLPVEFVGYKVHSATQVSTTQTVTVDGALTGGTRSSTQVGDYVVVFASGVDSGGNCSIQVSGFSAIAPQISTTNTYEGDAAVFGKILTGSLASVDVSYFGAYARDSVVITVLVFANVDAASPIDGSVLSSSSSSTSTATTPAVTPSSSGNMIVCLASSTDYNNATSYTVSTSFDDTFVAYQVETRGDVIHGVGLSVATNTSSFGPVTWTPNVVGSTPSYQAYSLVLNKA